MQILIVDDDNAIRAVIRKFIKDDSLGNSVTVFESTDGIEAFEKVCMYPIDIIFTDVKMPRCSGIELMERLNGLQYDGQIIVISGFDDYEYVHSAIRFGAVDYLLKPIDPDDFSMVLQKCMRNAERTSYLKQFYNSQMGLDKLMLIQQHRVEQLIQNDKIDEMVSEYAGDSVMVLQEVFRGYQPGKEETETLFIATQNAYAKVSGSFKLLQGNYLGFWVVIVNDIGKKQHEKLKEMLLKKYKYIAVSDLFCLSRADHIFDQCRRALCLTFYDFPNKGTDEGESSAGLVEEVCLNICNGSFDGLQKSSEKLFACLCRSRKNVGDTKKLLSDIVYKVMAKDNGFIRVISHYKLTDMDLVNVIQTAYSAYDLYKRFLELWHQYIYDYYEYAKESANSFMVQKAIRYVEANYRKEITLPDVADEVKLHPNYFSTLFKNETGVTFVRYLRRYRIHKAQQLMKDSSLKLYEIGEMVGYPDTTTFYRVFKEEMEMSPNHYRKMIDIDK